MLKQIKYTLLDIKIYKRINIIFLLQMIVVFLLLNSSIIDILSVKNGINRLENLKTNQAYINSDSTSNGKIDALLADEKNSIPKLKKLYKYIIDNKNYEKYCKWDYTTSETLNGHPIIQSTANHMFFNIYNINVIQGQLFDKSDYINNSTIIPIVIGYNLKDKYKLGQTYLENDPATNQKVTYKVIGVLENNTSYPSIIDIGKEINLNYTFFRALNNRFLNDFGSLDMAINSIVIFTNNKKYLDNIVEHSLNLQLFSMEYRPIENYINNYLKYFHKKVVYQLSIAFIILLFAAISMAINLSTIISKKIKEFSIHIMCGGTIKYILERILLQVIIIITFALIPTVCIYGFNIGFLFTVAIAFFIVFLVMIFPYIKLKNTNIIQLIRRND